MQTSVIHLYRYENEHIYTFILLMQNISDSEHLNHLS